MIALVIIVVLALGGGVSVAAENAAPGDALYSVKIEVNENVRAALAVTAEAKARWHAEVAERRLEEAEKLSARGTLTEEVATELSAGFRSHAEAALEAAQEHADKGNVEFAQEIVARVQASVAAHSNVLIGAETSSAANANASMIGILNSIRIQASGSSGAHVNVQSGDVNGDGTSDIRVGPSGVKSETSVSAEGGSRAEAESETKMEGSTKVQIDL